MASEYQPSIWTKVDYELVAVPAPTTEGPGSALDPAEWGRFWRWRRPLLDGVGAFVWLYAVLKVFVADVDSDLIGSAAQYRFVVFLALAVLLVVVLRRRWPIIGGFAYVIGFPLVLLCWKLPKAIGKTRGTVAFFAAANAITLLLSDLKLSIITTAFAALAALAIALSHARAVLIIAGSLMAVLLGHAMFRTIKISIRPSAFLGMQQLVIRQMVESQGLRKLMTPSADLRRVELERFTQEQQAAFVQSLAYGVLSHRVLSYWAYQLERYRRSAASIFFNGLAYLWLIARTVLGLAFINEAIFHANSAAFSFHTSPSFLAFTRYVIAGLYGGEIDALRPVGTIANAVSVLTFLLGLVVLGSLVLSSALGFRAATDESDLRDTIAEIKQERVTLYNRMREEYEVSVPEAIERLEQLKYDLMGVIRFLSTRIPTEFDDDLSGQSS